MAPDLPPTSSEVVVAGGSGSVETVMQSRADYPMRVDTVIVDYNNDGSSTPTTLELHEAPDGTAAGDLDATTRRKTLFLAAGDDYSEVGITMRDIQSDLLVLPDGNQDAEIAVYAGGYHVTSTRTDS